MPVNLSILNETSTKKKSKKSQNLPAGVNERDVELFTVSQETAKNFLTKENSRGKLHSEPSNITTADNKNEKVPEKSEEKSSKEKSENHGVPSQIAVPHLSSTTPGSSARYVNKISPLFLTSSLSKRQSKSLWG